MCLWQSSVHYHASCTFRYRPVHTLSHSIKRSIRRRKLLLDIPQLTELDHFIGRVFSTVIASKCRDEFTGLSFSKRNKLGKFIGNFRLVSQTKYYGKVRVLVR